MVLKLPELKSSGDATFDQVRRQDMQEFADWIGRNGGLDAAEQVARDAEANAHRRLAACYWHGEPDRAFDNPDIGQEHESGVWRRDRANWRAALDTLALFRAVNARAERLAA